MNFNPYGLESKVENDMFQDDFFFLWPVLTFNKQV